VASFLELAEPDIDGGAAECVRLGARRIIMLPHFLAPGLHVRRDLAAARDRLANQHPQVEVILAEPIGRHPLMLQILLDRARTVIPNIEMR
jgi:sirohydrochlorin ferrochelatase